MGEREPERCLNCDWLPQRSRRRCASCASYLQRHGHDKPIHLVIAHGRRRQERQAS